MWLIRLYSNSKIKSKCLLTLLVFIVPVLVIFSPYLITHFEKITKYRIDVIIALACAALWSFIGPLLIHKYFIMINDFVDNVDKSASSTNDLIEDTEPCQTSAREIYNDELISFNKRIKYISLIWGGLIWGILLLSPKQMESFCFYGYSDVYFWILLIYLAFIAYLQSFGFSAIILSIRLIKRCLQEETMLINVLEGSMGSGINNFGQVVGYTTLFFFSGILYFPILIIYAKDTSFSLTVCVYLLMVIFIIALIACFLVSCLYIRKHAKKAKEKLINEYREIYNEKMKKSLAHKKYYRVSQRSLLNELQIQNMYNHIVQLEKININPVGIQRITATIFTIIFPVLFFLDDLIQLIQDIQKGFGF